MRQSWKITRVRFEFKLRVPLHVTILYSGDGLFREEGT